MPISTNRQAEAIMSEGMKVHCKAISMQYRNEWSEGIALAGLDFLLLFNQVKSKRSKTLSDHTYRHAELVSASHILSNLLVRP